MGATRVVQDVGVPCQVLHHMSIVMRTVHNPRKEMSTSHIEGLVRGFFSDIVYLDSVHIVKTSNTKITEITTNPKVAMTLPAVIAARTEDLGEVTFGSIMFGSAILTYIFNPNQVVEKPLNASTIKAKR